MHVRCAGLRNSQLLDGHLSSSHCSHSVQSPSHGRSERRWRRMCEQPMRCADFWHVWNLRQRGTRPRLQCRADAAVADSEVITKIGFDAGFHEHYSLAEEPLGSGQEGEVFLGTSSTGERRAVKRIKKVFRPDGSLSPAFCSRLRSQVEVYQLVGRSLAAAHLEAAYEDETYVYMVQELCTGGELWKGINEGYSEAVAARIMKSVMQVLAQFHSHHIVWRDCKPDNFLFLNSQPDSPLKAIDFGTAVRCLPGDFLDAHAGSPVYVAPEVLTKKYCSSADLWSAGVVAYMLLTARLPWHGSWAVGVAELYAGTAGFGRRDALKALINLELDFESPDFARLSEDAKSFVKSLLQEEPTARPTAQEALKHPWLQLDSATHAATAPLSASLVQRLQRFHTYGKFKQAVLRGLVCQVSHHTISDDIRDQFAALDPGGTGLAELSELRLLLRSERFSLSDAEVERLLPQPDARGDSIGFDDFVAIMLCWQNVAEAEKWDQWVENAFDIIDGDKSGSVDASELREFLIYGTTMSPQAMEEAIASITTYEGDSPVLSLPAFKELLSGQMEDLNVFACRTVYNV